MSKLIQQVIEKAGSQEKAAAVLGVSQPAVSQYLAGTRTPRRPVVMLAEAYLRRTDSTPPR
jgi:predicted transcriptional regulator